MRDGRGMNNRREINLGWMLAGVRESLWGKQD
jgi:hypothetical protein